MRKRWLIALSAIALVTAGCFEDRSILYEGTAGGMSERRYVVGPVEALDTGRRADAMWRRELRARARFGPATSFSNLDPEELRSRLEVAAERYDFDVVSLEFLRPRQLAPKVVVRTKNYLDLARATPEILKRLDPREARSDDRAGWRYEGFYFEAQDERGVPFLIVFNEWRGPGGGGGQWARSERLFAFPHG